MAGNIPYNEQELIHRFAEGDERAFTIIYDQFYFIIYQYAKRWLSDKEDAEDITSDTFVKLLNRRKQFVSMENISAFLRVTARNGCFDFLKHDQVKTEKHADLLRQMSIDKEPDFTWLEIREEFLRLVYAEVEKMPKKMKEVFLLAYKEGLKPAEIAQRLHLNIQTVSNHKTNAVKLLKTALAGKSILFAFLVLLENDQNWPS